MLTDIYIYLCVFNYTNSDINVQPSLLVDFTAAPRWLGWQHYHQFPCPPKSPTCTYEVSLKLHCYSLDFSLQRPLSHLVYLILSATIRHHCRSPLIV
jgi:hypothetical protein